MDIFTLPEGYREIKSVNIQKDKKTAIGLNAVVFIIGGLMILLGLLLVPFDPEILSDRVLFFIKAFCLLFGMVLYMFWHEWIHGFFIKRYSGKKAKYSISALFISSGSEAFFNKHQYIMITVMPVIFLGIIFLLFNIFIPKEHFWFLYPLQIINIMGAADDCYKIFWACRFPDDLLIQDSGIAMTFYSKS